MIIKTLVQVLEVRRVLSHICYAYRLLLLGHKNHLIFHLMFLHAHCRQQITHLLLVTDLEVVRGRNNLLLLEMFPVDRVVLQVGRLAKLLKTRLRNDRRPPLLLLLDGHRGHQGFLRSFDLHIRSFLIHDLVASVVLRVRTGHPEAWTPLELLLACAGAVQRDLLLLIIEFCRIALRRNVQLNISGARRAIVHPVRYSVLLRGDSWLLLLQAFVELDLTAIQTSQPLHHFLCFLGCGRVGRNLLLLIELPAHNLAKVAHVWKIRLLGIRKSHIIGVNDGDRGFLKHWLSGLCGVNLFVLLAWQSMKIVIVRRDLPSLLNLLWLLG